MLRSDVEWFPRLRVMRPIERLDAIILALLLPCRIVGEELARWTQIGLKRLDLPIVPQEQQFAFILRQGNGTGRVRTEVYFEGGDDVESAIVRFGGGGVRLSVERNEMMEQIC